MDGGGILPVVAGQLGVADGGIEGGALGDHLALHAGHMPGVPGEVLGHIGDGHNRGLVEEDAAAHLDVGQLLVTGGQGLIQGLGGVGAPAIIHPVAGLDGLGGFLGGGELTLIESLIIHGKRPHFHNNAERNSKTQKKTRPAECPAGRAYGQYDSRRSIMQWSD